jgi:hypothetical protein
MTNVDIQQIKSSSGVKLSNGSRQQSFKRKNIFLKELPISIEDLTEEGNQCYAFKIKYHIKYLLFLFIISTQISNILNKIQFGFDFKCFVNRRNTICERDRNRSQFRV